MLKRGKVPQKPKMLNLLSRELLASEASSRLLLTVLSFQGNMRYETSPPQKKVALQSVDEHH